MKYSLRFLWLLLLPCLLFVLYSPLTYASEDTDSNGLIVIDLSSEDGLFFDGSLEDYKDFKNNDISFYNDYNLPGDYGFVYNTAWRLPPNKWDTSVDLFNEGVYLSDSQDYEFQQWFDYSTVIPGGTYDVIVNIGFTELYIWGEFRGVTGIPLDFASDSSTLGGFVSYRHTRALRQDATLLDGSEGYKYTLFYDDITIPDTSYICISYDAFLEYDGYAFCGFPNFQFIKVDNSEELLTNIQDNTTETNSKLGNIITQITELPNKIWTVFSDGLKSLFIPSEEDITDQQDKWNQLLEDRFGALYQTIDMIHDYAETFTEPETQGQIEFPAITVELAGSDFVFGGQMVDVVPDGFEFLIDVVKTIISILATILFVNGLKNRFERLVGGSDDI